MNSQYKKDLIHGIMTVKELINETTVLLAYKNQSKSNLVYLEHEVAALNRRLLMLEVELAKVVISEHYNEKKAA